MNHNLRIYGLILVAVATTSPLALAQDRLILLDGKTVDATVSSIDEKGAISGENIPLGTTVDGLRRIETPADVQVVNSPITARLLGGSILGLSKFTIDNDQNCHLINPVVGELAFPIDAMRAVRFDSETLEASFEAGAKEKGDDDRVFVRIGGGLEPINGLVDSIDEFNVVLDVRGEKRTIARDKVYGIVFALVGKSPDHSGETLATLTDGSTLWGKVSALADGKLTLQAVTNAEVVLPWAKVNQLAVRSSRLVFLSDLQPVEARHQPLVTLERPWQADLSVAGRPLTLAGRVYDKGIGVASRSTLVFENTGGFNLLAATIGLDDETEKRGDCVFVVEVDGREQYRQRVVGRDPPRNIAVDISGGQQIALIVETGEDLDLSDHADWCDARLVKE